MKLTVKLPAFAVGAILLTAIASGVLSVAIGRHVLRQTALDGNARRVEIYASAVSFYVESANALLGTVAALPRRQTVGQSRELAALVLAQSQVFEYVGLLSPEGVVTLLEPSVLEGGQSHKDWSFNAWFRQARQANTPVVSDLHISPATQRPTIVIVAPIAATADGPRGFWIGGIRLKDLSEIGTIGTTLRRDGSASFVTDRRGLVIAHQSKPDYVENQTDFSAAPSVKLALAGQSGSGEFFNPIEQELKFAAYRPLPNLGWAVVNYAPVRETMAPAQEFREGITWAGAILAILFGVGMFFSTRRLVLPIRQLGAAARTIGKGDYGSRIEKATSDEFGELAAEFNRMAQALAEKNAVITERTESLQETLSYSRSLLEASIDPLVTISPQGMITDVNEASIAATGVARDNLVGTDFSSYFTEPEKARAGYQRVFTEGYVTDYPLTIRRHDGKLTEVLYNASVYRNGAGEVVGVFAAARDMTRQRQLEASLRDEIVERGRAHASLEQATLNLKRSNEELEQFAYVASHDLQEPLRMVVGYVQLLERRLAGKLDADAREFMGYAVDGALRMQNLIQDILAYSRVTTKGKLLQRVDSGAAFKDALKGLSARIDETAATIASSAMPVVMADRSQLVQLFQNLVSNAIKFSKDVPKVHVEARHRDGWWRFSVTDNGIGIEPAYRAQLFVIFKRLHTRREYPGTGIGLAICKRIVERHGGKIGIDSAPGGGTTFWFTLPEEATP